MREENDEAELEGPAGGKMKEFCQAGWDTLENFRQLQGVGMEGGTNV